MYHRELRLRAQARSYLPEDKVAAKEAALERQIAGQTRLRDTTVSNQTAKAERRSALPGRRRKNRPKRGKEAIIASGISKLT